MESSWNTSVEEIAIHQLEVLSIFLGSHPEMVDSMTAEEVSEELWEMGISPDPPVDLEALTTELVSGPKGERVSLALGELIDADLAVRSESLRRLFARLQEIEGIEYSWVAQICANPKSLSQRFEGGHTADEFLMNNDLAGWSGCSIDLELAEEYKGYIDLSQISIVAFYPSGAIRSVPTDVSLSGRMLHFTIRDILVFLDPDADQPIKDILPFWAPVTLFAIQC